jgi:hypothetical protein
LINREIWRKALRSSKLRALGAVLAAAALAAVIPWRRIGADFLERRAQREAIAASLAEARAANISFPQVVVGHPDYLGKAVYWDVTTTSMTVTYAAGYTAGRPGWPIVWRNPQKVRAEIEWVNQTKVLARVMGVRDDVVYLEYLGRP